MQFKDIKSRLILVDFIPGSHGHFFVSVMNSLIQENYTIRDETNPKNFHQYYFIPPVIWEDRHVSQPLDNVDVNVDVVNVFKFDRPIFWGMHWSNYWARGYSVYKHEFRSYINGYNLVELYFSGQSHEQYFINSIYNVGNASREDILDSEKFNDVFYETANVIDSEIVKYVPTNQPWKKLSTADVIGLLEAWLIKQNRNNLTKSTQQFSPQEKRYLHTLDLRNPCVSFDVSYFYDYNMFVLMVERIFGYYNLSVPINYEFLKTQWDHLMSKQVKSDIRNKGVNDRDLHPAQLAYRNYLRKFNAL